MTFSSRLRIVLHFKARPFLKDCCFKRSTGKIDTGGIVNFRMKKETFCS